MPIVMLNSALVAIRGRVVDVVFKTYRDKIVMTRVPRFTPGAATPAQRGRRDRMKAATAFAQRVYASAPAKAFYTDEARRLGRQPLRLAISDHLYCADSPAGDETSADSVRYSAAVRLLDSSASPSRLAPSPACPPKPTRPLAAASVRVSRSAGDRQARSCRVRPKGRVRGRERCAGGEYRNQRTPWTRFTSKR